jgi:hypothetical protein
VIAEGRQRLLLVHGANRLKQLHLRETYVLSSLKPLRAARAWRAAATAWATAAAGGGSSAAARKGCTSPRSRNLLGIMLKRRHVRRVCVRKEHAACLRDCGRHLI